MNIRTSIAAGGTLAALVLLAACSGGTDPVATLPASSTATTEATPGGDTDATPAGTIGNTDIPAQDVTPAGTVLALGDSAVVEFHVDGFADPQLIRIAVTSISPIDSADIPASLDEDGVADSLGFLKVMWETQLAGPSVIPMAERSFDAYFNIYNNLGYAAYAFAPRDMPDCVQVAPMGDAFDQGEVVTSCVLVAYSPDWGPPPYFGWSEYMTDTADDVIKWEGWN